MLNPQNIGYRKTGIFWNKIVHLPTYRNLKHQRSIFVTRQGGNLKHIKNVLNESVLRRYERNEHQF